jgi:hypothetical protein
MTFLMQSANPAEDWHSPAKYGVQGSGHVEIVRDYTDKPVSKLRLGQPIGSWLAYFAANSYFG